MQWLTSVRARAYVLTQGSRSGSDSARRRACEQLIASRGGDVAPWGGVWDKDFYQYVLAGDAAPFVRWTQELAEDFVRREVDLVVADAWQYYNIAHDLTHVMARLAVDRAQEVLGRRIEFLDYPVVPRALAPDEPDCIEKVVLALDVAQSAAKRESVDAVADVAGEAAEIEGIEGAESYCRETLREPPPLSTLLRTPAVKPLYERFGEERVQSNIYFNVIRWSHAEQICRALNDAFATADVAAR